MPEFMGKLGKLAMKGGKALGKRAYNRSNVKMGVDAFRSFRDKKKDAGSLPEVGAKPAPKKIGEFSTGIDTNLKVPKPSGLQRQPLY